MREETRRPSRSIPGSKTGVTSRILVFFVVGQSPQHQACWQQMGYMCLKEGKGSLLAGLSERALNLKGEGVKTRLARDKPGGGMPVFEGRCASKVHHVLSTLECI